MTKQRREKFFTKSQVVEALRLAIGTQSQVAFSTKLGISPQLLCDVLKGRRDLPEGVLAFLGLEEVKNLYRRKNKG